MAWGQGGYSGDMDEIEAALEADAAEVGGGLLGYDEDEDYQGQMMDQYTKDFEGDYDARNLGQKFGDWFEKHNPLIQGFNKLGFNASLDRTLGTGHDVGGGGAESRDDQVAENTCAAVGGTWDGGSCVMPSVDDDVEDDDGGGGGGYDPFASLTRKRQMFYHPMLETTAYSGERPDYINENIWDYKPPRAGAELKNWAGGLRNWASGD